MIIDYPPLYARPELVPEERAVKLTDMLNRVADKILRLLATPPGANHAPTLSFWMGNASELLHFLKSDRHITAFSLQVGTCCCCIVRSVA